VGTTVLDHDGPFTERDFLELTPRHGHVELVEGTLLVGPMAGPEHVAAVAAVRAALEKALPDGLRVVGDVPPDLLDCADVLMVVDVVDRTHGITQRSFKPQLYARSRIPYAVLVDSAARVGSASMLIGGRHHEFAQAGAGERLLLEEPFRVEIDLAALAAEAAGADQ
jgi:hypothetical protein